MEKDWKRLSIISVFLLVLLRIAIGWHFLYEGLVKLEADFSAKGSWSSEAYLRYSVGPLAPLYKWMVNPDGEQDIYGLKWLDREALSAKWTKEAERLLSQGSEGPIREALTASIGAMDQYFQNPETQWKINAFREGVEDWIENSRTAVLPHEKAELHSRRTNLVLLRDELVGPVKEIEASLAGRFREAAPGTEVFPPKKGSWGMVWLADQFTMWGLTVVGLGLMLGLLSRLSALGAVGFLTMFYLAYPSWPGLPLPPIAEGSYMIVDKNLLELLACLFLATVPTGKWIGLDALLTKLFRKRSPKGNPARNQAAAASN